MILIIDNYDSFVYNIYQYIAEINSDILIRRNDAISLKEIEKLNPSHIILSPGPKRPIDAGICIELIKKFYQSIPILGICLGHQAIAKAFAWNVIKADELMHGKTSEIQIIRADSKIHLGIRSRFIATRYHSLIVSDKVENSFYLTAQTKNHIIMGIEHKNFPLFGIQYHPESILTEFGKEHFRNFLNIKKATS